MWEQKLIETRVFSVQDFPVTAPRDYNGGAGFFYPGGMARPVGFGPSAATMPLSGAYPVMAPPYGMVPSCA